MSPGRAQTVAIPGPLGTPELILRAIRGTENSPPYGLRRKLRLHECAAEKVQRVPNGGCVGTPLSFEQVDGFAQEWNGVAVVTLRAKFSGLLLQLADFCRWICLGLQRKGDHEDCKQGSCDKPRKERKTAFCGGTMCSLMAAPRPGEFGVGSWKLNEREDPFSDSDLSDSLNAGRVCLNSEPNDTVAAVDCRIGGERDCDPTDVRQCPPGA